MKAFLWVIPLSWCFQFLSLPSRDGISCFVLQFYTKQETLSEISHETLEIFNYIVKSCSFTKAGREEQQRTDLWFIHESHNELKRFRVLEADPIPTGHKSRQNFALITSLLAQCSLHNRSSFPIARLRCCACHDACLFEYDMQYALRPCKFPLQRATWMQLWVGGKENANTQTPRL